MGVVFAAGYVTNDQPTTHARILHAKNRIPMKTVVASDTSDLSVDVLSNSLTYEKWAPFSNELADGSDLSTASWTLFRVTVSADGQTITETTDTGFHYADQVFTFTATEYVTSVRVKRQTVPEVLLIAYDGVTYYTAYFDLRDGSVGSVSNASGGIYDLGDNEYLLRMVFTPAAGAGEVNIRMSDGAENTSYTGSTDNTIQVLEVVTHESVATVDFTPFTSTEADTFCIAAHNLGASGGNISIEYGAGHTDIMGAAIAPADNSPIMAFFTPTTASEWRMTVDSATLPEIGVVRWGNALQMTRPIYAGHTPINLSRETSLSSNYSETGEFLGRSVVRNFLKTSCSWTHLKADWVRTSLRPFMLAAESEPFFIAWRPSTFSEAAYGLADGPIRPSNMGVNDYMQASVAMTGLSYD